MSDPQNQFSNNLYTADQVRELDRIAIEDIGIPGLSLMQRAGGAAFEEFQKAWPDCTQLAVVCGLGNNAGDGYVLARLAKQQQCDVTIIQMGDSSKLKGDARVCFDELRSLSVPIVIPDEIDWTQYEVIVDAIFGTGLDRAVSGDWARVIQAINQSGSPVFALDIPSGLDADTGMPLGVAIEADKTITFIGMKQGLLTGRAGDFCGECIYADLGVPDSVYQKLGQASCHKVEFEQLKKHIPSRKPSTHKGDYGHVLIIGGDAGFAGAARMAAEAAARCGAGLVSVATHPDHAHTLNIGRPELMVHAVERFRDLDPLLSKASVLAIGPGLGQSDWAMQLLARVSETGKPQVWDADALNLLAQDPSQNPYRVITPHPGEAARMLGVATPDIQSDRFSAIRQLQQRYAGVVVLKGFGTLIINQDQEISVCTDGNPGMATGGMGDVLTGIISGLLAQGHSLPEAATLGVCLHSAAADEASELGQRGLLASDLFPYLRYLVNF